MIRFGFARTYALVRNSGSVRVWLTVVGVGALLIGRRPDSFFTPQLWAEDGSVFYARVLIEGPVRTLFEPYAGYLQLVPRLVSIVCAQLPAAAVPCAFALTAYIISIWACSLFIESRFSSIVASAALRFLVCCAIAVVPPANELVGTITNSHWYLSVAAFFLLIAEPLSGRRFVLRNAGSALAVLLASLSGGETLFFTPLALWRAVVLRETSARAVPMAFLAGAVAQTIALKLDPTRDGPFAHATTFSTIVATVDAFVHRVAITATVGQPVSEFLSAHDLTGAVLGISVSFAVAAVFGVQRLSTIRLGLILLTSLSLLWIAAALDGRGLAIYYPGLRVTYYGGERYFMFPIVTFIVSVAMIIDRIAQLRSSMKCACFAVVFAGGMCLNYRLPPLADMHWRSYSAGIDNWIGVRRRGEPVRAIRVPINPPGSHFTLPARP